MRSYEAARGLFGFLGFCSWIVIIGGALIALAGAGAVGNGFGRDPNAMQAALAALPGLTIAVLGLYGLALVQMGRAGVDSAEYSQQMLQVAREQFSLTKKIFKQGEPAQVPTFEPTASSAKSDTYPHNPTRSEPPVSTPMADGTLLEYGGHKISKDDGKFLFNGRSFETLIDAKLAVDGVRMRSETAAIEQK